MELTQQFFRHDFVLSKKGSKTSSTQVPNTSFEPLKDSLAGVHLASESIVGTSGTPSTSINLAFEIPHFQHNSVYTFGIASRNPHAHLAPPYRIASWNKIQLLASTWPELPTALNSTTWPALPPPHLNSSFCGNSMATTSSNPLAWVKL